MEFDCKHNARCRYTHGFFCEDCGTFFHKDTPVYRRGELLSSLWMALHNVNAESLQRGGPEIHDALTMRDKIGIGVEHADYETIIAEAEQVLARYGKDVESASLVIG